MTQISPVSPHCRCQPFDDCEGADEAMDGPECLPPPIESVPSGPFAMMAAQLAKKAAKSAPKRRRGRPPSSKTQPEVERLLRDEMKGMEVQVCAVLGCF